MGNAESMQVFQEGELEEDFRRGGGTGDVSLWELFQKGYNKLVDFIIEPDRKHYGIDQLGPREFQVMQQKEGTVTAVCRTDFEIQTGIVESRTIVGSYWCLASSSSSSSSSCFVGSADPPCIIYLHCNIGCRVDVCTIRDKALAYGFHVLAFDFIGCGQSGSDYVTGGLKESQDVGRIVAYVRVHFEVGQIYLWGHSLGAAAALMYSANNSSISGLVLDSAYLTLTQLADDIMLTIQSDGFAAPSWILKQGRRMICSSVEEKAGFKVEQVRPIDFAKDCRMPAVVLTATGDKYVPTQHADTFVRVYGGPVSQLRFESDHYGARPDDVVEFALDFLTSLTQQGGKQARGVLEP